MVLELKVFTAEEVGQVFAQFAQHGFGLRFFVWVLIFVHLSEQQRADQDKVSENASRWFLFQSGILLHPAK